METGDIHAPDFNSVLEMESGSATASSRTQPRAHSESDDDDVLTTPTQRSRRRIRSPFASGEEDEDPDDIIQRLHQALAQAKLDIAAKTFECEMATSRIRRLTKELNGGTSVGDVKPQQQGTNPSSKSLAGRQRPERGRKTRKKPVTKLFEDIFRIREPNGSNGATARSAAPARSSQVHAQPVPILGSPMSRGHQKQSNKAAKRHQKGKRRGSLRSRSRNHSEQIEAERLAMATGSAAASQSLAITEAGARWRRRQRLRPLTKALRTRWDTFVLHQHALQQHVFLCLDVRSLLCCGQTCRNWSAATAHGAPLWARWARQLSSKAAVSNIARGVVWQRLLLDKSPVYERERYRAAVVKAQEARERHNTSSQQNGIRLQLAANRRGKLL